jgi:hypothetical protein
MNFRLLFPSPLLITVLTTAREFYDTVAILFDHRLDNCQRVL